MPEVISVKVNGKRIDATTEMTALAAIVASGAVFVRRSVAGECRGALCGMGICFECQAMINGEKRRSCQMFCRQGMDIQTDE